MGDSEQISCRDCGEPLDLAARDAPCPKCGSQAKHWTLTLEDQGIRPRDTIQGSLKDLRRPKKKRVRYQFFDGAEMRRSEGDYVHKERIIDVDRDRYRELVVTDDGTVLIDVDHSLKRDHRGHGSAKFRVPPPVDDGSKG